MMRDIHSDVLQLLECAFAPYSHTNGDGFQDAFPHKVRKRPRGLPCFQGGDVRGHMPTRMITSLR